MASAQGRNGEEGQDLHGQLDEEQDLERQPLLHTKPAEQKQQKELAVDSSASLKLKHAGKGHSRTNSLDKQDAGQCRICLEEDSLRNLESPCGCTGTQQYAHKDCIQKWINEKHNAMCEICDQPYKGPYTVPPAPPQEAGEQLQVVAPLGSLYLTVEDNRVANLLSDVYDDWDDHRQPTVSWCFSLMMFLLFLMFLHSSVTVSLPADSSSSSSGPGAPPSLDPSGAPSGSSSIPGGAAAGFAAGASLFLMWMLTKVFLIMLPLLMVMRLAARAQEQAAEAAAAAAEGQGPARPAAGSSSSSPRHYQSMVARMLGSNGLRSSSGLGHGHSSSLSDLETEVLATRRAALSRLGQDPTFLGPATAAAIASGASRPVIGARDGAGQQQEQVAAAEQRMLAAVRAMVQAALVNAAAQQERGRAAGAAAADDGSAPPRLSGVV